MKGLNGDFLTEDDLASFGIRNAKDRRILVHSTCVIPNWNILDLAHDIRIDPFCILTGRDIQIGDHVHIGSHCSLTGRGIIRLESFSGLSAGCRIFSSSDDYSGAFLTNPTVPEIYTNVTSADVVIEKHAIIGPGSVVLPGARIGEGVSVGAQSLVNKPLDPWMIYAGTPARILRKKSRMCLHYEQDLLDASKGT